DDGVMPQTVESINHAKAAEVIIVVAINKIDKPDAQPDRIKQQLSEHGLVPEEWGGDTMMVPVSARTGEGIEKLLEAILLKADVQGSVEAMKNALTRLSGTKVAVDVIHSGVGNVTESDVMLATASKALVVGFNVKSESGADESAAAEGVEIKHYSIIYEAL